MPRLERPLVALGSFGVAVVLGWGVVSAAPPGPAGPPRRPAVAAPGRPGPARPPTPPKGESRQGVVDWALLTSYEYQPGLANVPDAVRALDGKTVVMHGFLMPLYEFDDIHEFVLVGSHMSCCFGIPAGINGQVVVRLAQKDGLPNTNEPLEIRGTFHVREKSEQGYVLSIYDIDGATGFVKGY